MLARYSYLWDGSAEGWVLLRDDVTPDKYLIFNTRTRCALLIEGEQLAQQLKDEMLAHNVQVLDHLPPGDVIMPDAYNDTPKR